MRRFSTILAVLIVGASLSACSTRDPESLAQNDPLEPFNRASFKANLKLDKYFAKPIAKGYVAVVPEFARDGVHNFLTNLDEPITFANNIIQVDPSGAAHTLVRFTVNSTVGIGGLIDVASKVGYPDDPQDFGITIGKYGLKEGDYLFLPFLGPSSPRDVLGTVVDIGFDPLTYISFNNSTTWYMARQGFVILDTRAQTLDQLEGIERTSVDFYATTRSLYRQHRNAQIHGGAADLTNLPNY